MKLIVATIQEDMLESIRESIHDPAAYVLYVGMIGDLAESLIGSYRGAEYRQPRPRFRLEIVVANDLAVDDVVDSIARIAGAGSIFIMPMDAWIRLPAAVSKFTTREAS